MHRVLFCMLEVVEDEFYLLEVLEVLEVMELMRCVRLFLLEALGDGHGFGV